MDGKCEGQCWQKKDTEDRKEGFFTLLDLAYTLDDAGRNTISFAHMIRGMFPSSTQQAWLLEWGKERYIDSLTS